VLKTTFRVLVSTTSSIARLGVGSASVAPSNVAPGATVTTFTPFNRMAIG